VGLIKFLIEDLKKDFITIKKIIKGTAKIDPKKRKELTTGWNTFLADNWLFFLIILLAFFSGWWIASQYYQSVCNQLISETVASLDFVNNLDINFSLVK